jgi:exopolyphosphatase / guanosine-5'-triphosphate,3'-diphosphate pyrophosphatase
MTTQSIIHIIQEVIYISIVMEKQRFALIDIGTLKIKFEIDEIGEKLKRKVVYRTKELTVMGRDLPKTNGMIIEESIQKAITTLLMYKAVLVEHNVLHYKVIATEALRKAKNVNQVLSRIKGETGFDVEIITANEEASILFESISKDFPNKTIAVVDVGGGSVQVIIGKNNDIFEIYPFKAGTYFMQEEFYSTHHPTLKEYKNAKVFLKKEFTPLEKSKHKPEYIVYGTTNILDFMRAMDIPLEKLSYSGFHQYKTNIKNLVPVYEKIRKLSYEDRMSLYPEEPYYMWSADNAILIIEQISKYLDCTEIVPSNNNTSIGMLENLAKEFYNISNPKSDE